MISLLDFSPSAHAQTKLPTKKKVVSTVKANIDTKDSNAAKPKMLYITREWTKVEKDSMDVMKHTSITQPCEYLTKKEKEVIWYLNVARMYPQWYLYFFLKNPKTENEKSLHATMKAMKPVSKTLIPTKNLYEIAKCHATTSGIAGYVGHERQSTACKSIIGGECCQYGYDDAAMIVLDLLIDEGVPSLGHRNIILDTTYNRIGVSIQPHKTYRHNAVLDFGF